MELQCVDVRQPWEVFRSVRVHSVAGRAGAHEQHRLVAPVFELHVAVRQRPNDVEQEPTGNDDLAFTFDIRIDGRAQRELHIGRCELQPALGSP